MRRLLTAVAILCFACLFSTPRAKAVSCTVAASLSPAARAALLGAAQQLGNRIVAGDAAGLKADTIASVAASFDGIAGTVTNLAPSLKGASLTVENLYMLDASDLQGSQDDVQFFCGLPGSQLLVTVTLNQLPQGMFALAVAHASGVKNPQQFAIILENTTTGDKTGEKANWKLAGLIARELTMNGHDSVWYWTQAREKKAKNQALSSFLYYETAAYLARPADLYTSNNLQKLGKEAAAIEPPGLPGNNPMQITANGATYSVTGLRADTTLGTFDLRVDSKVPTVSDPVAARKDALGLMQALLQQHPGLRESFHGLWVFETTPNGQNFAVEQPMSAIP